MNATLPLLGLIAILIYFFSLIGLSLYRARSATLNDYLIGSRNSTWWLITLGLLSESISGVTYVSVPGAVSQQQYGYMQIVFGYFFGYLTIAYVLLPLYYRLNLISIYGYLRERFGPVSQKTGACIFIASRTFGSAARLYLAVMVLHEFFFRDSAFSPILSFTIAMILIVAYTYKGGIKSIIWTDAFQAIFLLLGVFSVLAALLHTLPDSLAIVSHPQLFFWDPMPKNFFFKQFIGGMFITIALNGLDQNIMQKSLSCKNISEAQKNMVCFAFADVVVNFFFLALGALVQAAYLQFKMSGVAPDRLLPNLVFTQLGMIPALLFILGLVAAAFGSAGSVLPPLASSLELDLFPERWKNLIPVRVMHLVMATVLLGVIILIYQVHTESLIGVILRYAGYTYGPLLGLFAIGILTRWKLREKWVPLCALASCLVSAFLDKNSASLLGGYQIGIELILINALIFILLSMGIKQKL